MDYDIYKLPLAVSDGVWISLKKAPKVRFRVTLPMQCNEAFQLKLMARLSGAEGKFDSVTYARERKNLFFAECIVEAEGLPKGMGPDEFFADYPLAAMEVLTVATDMAETADRELDEALGN